MISLAWSCLMWAVRRGLQQLNPCKCLKAECKQLFMQPLCTIMLYNSDAKLFVTPIYSTSVVKQALLFLALNKTPVCRLSVFYCMQAWNFVILRPSRGVTVSRAQTRLLARKPSHELKVKFKPVLILTIYLYIVSHWQWSTFGCSCFVL